MAERRGPRARRRTARALRGAAPLTRDLASLARTVAAGLPTDALVAQIRAVAARHLPEFSIEYVEYGTTLGPVGEHEIVEVVRAADRAVGALVASRRGGVPRAEEVTCIAALATVLSAAVTLAHHEQSAAANIRIDPLTGALNRVGLTEVLGEMLESPADGRMLAVMCLDLDHFGAINESYGYATGDAVLAHIARRLAVAAGPHGLVARIEADRFVTIAPAADHSEISRLAQRVQGVVARPLAPEGTRGHPLTLTACLGYVAALPGADLADVVLRDAVTTLENARRRGHGSVCFVDDDIRRTGETRQFLAEALPRALANGDLTTVYQPIVDARTQALVGAEALVRWTHPERGAVSPVDLVSTAERLGIVHLIGEQMLDRACAQLARWRRDGVVSPSFTVTVNMSPSELVSPNLVARVDAVLSRHHLPPSRLCLEITENAFIDDLAACARTAAALRSLGVRVAVDDFGTGYSSLAYLDRLPLDMIKIDRSFVERIGIDAGPRAIVAGLVAVAHELGLVVVAEGVEQSAQLAAVTGLGCHRVQGFLIGTPMAPERFEAWITETSRAPESLVRVGAAAS